MSCELIFLGMHLIPLTTICCDLPPANQIGPFDRRQYDGLFQQTVEQQPMRTRVATVEAEGEHVQIVPTRMLGWKHVPQFDRSSRLVSHVLKPLPVGSRGIKCIPRMSNSKRSRAHHLRLTPPCSSEDEARSGSGVFTSRAN